MTEMCHRSSIYLVLLLLSFYLEMLVTVVTQADGFVLNLSDFRKWAEGVCHCVYQGSTLKSGTLGSPFRLSYRLFNFAIFSRNSR